MNYDARMLDPKAKEALRLRVARAVVDEGMTQGDAVRTFHVGRTSVHNWAIAYRAGGEAALRTKPMGRPKRATLPGHQAAAVVNHITDHTPDQLKLPFVLWTRQAVQQLIADRFDRHLSLSTVGRCLRRWGFTPQKPVRRASEQDPQAVEHWLKQTYPKIKARAKRENAEIHWADEMGLRSDHQTGTSYAPCGKTPVIAGTGQRFGCNMISTITNHGTLRFMVFKHRFTADVMIEFLGRLLRQVDRKVFVILDGHPVHRARKVKAWVADRMDRIELFQLPGYSPQLNPDELLNQDVKSNALGRRRPATQDEMITDVRGYLRGTQRRPEIVRSYFSEEHVRYAAEQ
jgi:transposase